MMVSLPLICQSIRLVKLKPWKGVERIRVTPPNWTPPGQPETVTDPGPVSGVGFVANGFPPEMANGPFFWKIARLVLPGKQAANWVKPRGVGVLEPVASILLVERSS